MSSEQTIQMRRYAHMKHAAIAYAITRIRDFSNDGKDLTVAERAAITALLDEGTAQ